MYEKRKGSFFMLLIYFYADISKPGVRKKEEVMK
jgi:hypothetical protein